MLVAIYTSISVPPWNLKVIRPSLWTVTVSMMVSQSFSSNSVRASNSCTSSRTHPEYYDGSIPWLKTGDLTDSYITDIPEGISQLALEKTSVRLNESGSVLMAMYGATIGKLGILTYPATTNQACCACKPVYGVQTLFLFYFLMSQRTAFIKRGEGGAQPNISKEKIVTTLMPLPPLAEQYRIVQRIEELLPLVKGL